MDSWRQDLRVALRKWLSRPGLTLVVVLTLGFGIGANAAIFSVVNSVLLRPLPYPDADRLVLLHTELPRRGTTSATSSGPELQDYLDNATAFEHLGALWYRAAALTDDGVEPEDIDMAFVSAGLLPALGVEPALGRYPEPDEDVDGGPRVIVLADHTWRRRYGGDPQIVGRSVELDGVPHLVVGVMPAGFRIHLPIEVGVPPLLDAWVTWGGAYRQYPRSWRVFTLLGRMAPGRTRADASAEMYGLAGQLAQDFPEDYTASGLGIRLEPLERDAVAHVRPLLGVLLGAVGLVVLIACANVANLLLVRASGTVEEITLRIALGASRWRLLRQAVTDSAVIAILGSGVGLLLGAITVRLLPLLAPDNLPRTEEIGIDGAVLGLTLLATAITALGFGAVSMLYVRRTAGPHALAIRTTSGARQQAVRTALVVGELAVSLVLLVGAGLLLRSFERLTRVDPGFTTEGVQTMKLSLVDSHYPYSEPNKIADFYRQLTTRVAELPGVDAAGATSELPLDGNSYVLAPYSYETPNGLVEWDSVAADYRVVTAGWLEAMGARLVTGRTFEQTDDAGSARVVIVDETLARTAWPGKRAIGQRVRIRPVLFSQGEATWAEVVGVVEHLHHDPRRVGTEQIFLPHAQSPLRSMTLTMRTESDSRSLATRIRGIVRELNADQPVQAMRPLTEYFDEAMADMRFALALVSLFAVVAATLAVVGVYGLISFGVSLRRREIGIRMALGAAPGVVLRSVVGQASRITAIGIVIGVAGALGAASLMSSLLYGVSPGDPLTLIVVTALMALTGLAAGVLPARRASRTDPSNALRAD